MNITKIGPVEMYEHEAARLYTEKKYVVTFSKVYQVHFSQAQNKYYGSIVYQTTAKHGVGLTRRGRYTVLTGHEVNALIGHAALN